MNLFFNILQLSDYLAGLSAQAKGTMGGIDFFLMGLRILSNHFSIPANCPGISFKEHCVCLFKLSTGRMVFDDVRNELWEALGNFSPS